MKSCKTIVFEVGDRVKIDREQIKKIFDDLDEDDIESIKSHWDYTLIVDSISDTPSGDKMRKIHKLYNQDKDEKLSFEFYDEELIDATTDWDS
jgi:hypothetical protein